MDNALEAERAPPKKRRRTVVSCTECHRRKQKCDRGVPCANCRSRNRESFCSYEPSAASARGRETISKELPSDQDPSSAASNDESFSSMAARLGYRQTGPSTIDFLKRIETSPIPGEQIPMSKLSSRDIDQDTFVVREKYKGLIRQLPAKAFIDKSANSFMREFNWQYYFVDPDIFYRQLQEWNALPFNIFYSEGLQGISPDLRVFPAVLFQIIATALLIVSDDCGKEFTSLKYAADMTFEDLACDYSDSGAKIINLFGKKSLCATTVQAEFLRASFLKFTANVTESWHMVGIAIRDAQELGMHRDSLDPKPTGTDLDKVLENQWAIERRRKLYMVLAIWDIGMCIILGRPGTVDWKHGCPSLPIDAPVPSDRSKTPVMPRNPEKDPPTPLTRALWLQDFTDSLRGIQDLEQDGPYPKDFSKVDRLQQEILLTFERMPAVFRLEHPDTRWDGHPDVHWIHATRYYFSMLHEFSLMALHRPYVFHRRESRSEALRASLQMLDCQRLMFEGSPSTSWRNFMLFFGAFDAIVLIVSIYILFPHEHTEQRDSLLEHVNWAVERFSAMQDRNSLAKAADGVLQAILAKFTRSVSANTSANATPGSSSRGPAVGGHGYVPVTATTIATTATASTTPMSEATAFAYVSSSDWAVPRPETLASIVPTFATSDLLFNDLTAIQDCHAGEEAMLPATSVASAQAPLTSDPLAWQFGGEFEDGSLWQILNQYQPRE